MPRIPAETVERYRADAEAFLARHNLTCANVKTGRDAWTVAHSAGITADAYRDRDTLDAHIQTALEKIFPAAVFNDPKRY